MSGETLRIDKDSQEHHTGEQKLPHIPGDGIS